jgi:hypothetical protein
MRTVDVVNNLLQELGSKIGMEQLSLNNKGICEFKYQDSFDFIIEVPENSSTIFFYSPLIQVSEYGSEKLFLKVLKLNFLCLETNGATFAYDGDKGYINLCYRHSIEHLDSLTFENIVGNFLDVAEKWYTHLQNYIDEVVPESNSSFSNEYQLRV